MVEKLTCGGSAVPTRILNAFEARGLSFSQGYGMTETSPGATSLAPAMTRAKQGSVGLPHFFTEVRVTDDTGAVVPAGTVGEIEIAGPNVFPGYHGLPDETAASFREDGWFRSGDLGYLDEDGYLFISDRLKDMIISGGENIYPAEVENLINDIRGISGVAVIGVPDERWGEVPWAVVTVKEGAEVTTESVRTQLDGVLARYKLPKNVVVVEDLPRTASGLAQVWVHGRRCPVVGLISMDQFVADVGGLPVAAGEVATIFGAGTQGEPTAAEWARWAGTIEHEILTGIGSRVQR